MTAARCTLCHRPMIPSGDAERPDDPRIDCAGDCLGCIRHIEARDHTETARYWKAMYEDQLRRKRALHERFEETIASLREVYDYMCEVEGAHAGCCAVRSYMSLPRTDPEREAIGHRARVLLGIHNETMSS